MFESFDFGSALNQKALESPEGAATTISIKKLGSNDYKHEKVKVTMRMITKFAELDKPRLVIEVQKGKGKDHALSERARKAIRAKTKVAKDRPNNDKQPDEMDKILEDKFMIEVNEKKGSMKRTDSSKSLFPLTIIIFGFIGTMALLTAGIYTTANFRGSWFSFMVKEVGELSSRNL